MNKQPTDQPYLIIFNLPVGCYSQLVLQFPRLGCGCTMAISQRFASLVDVQTLRDPARQSDALASHRQNYHVCALTHLRCRAHMDLQSKDTLDTDPPLPCPFCTFTDAQKSLRCCILLCRATCCDCNAITGVPWESGYVELWNWHVANHSCYPMQVCNDFKWV